VSLFLDPNFSSIQSQISRILSTVGTGPLSKVSELLTAVVGDGFQASGAGPGALPAALYAPPASIGNGAERTMSWPERSALLNQASGSGANLSLPSGSGTDYVAANQAKYLAQMSPEQQAMWQLQQAQNRQAEAAALMAALEKARHDAMMAIIQKIA
jgi:hypothetical protein